MRFGILLDHQYGRDDDLSRRIPELLSFVETVRDLGFDSVFGIHHYLSGLRTLQPLSLLARLVDVSGSMQIGTGILHPPAQRTPSMWPRTSRRSTSSRAARFVLGVGAGYRDDEFAAFGIDKRKRCRRMIEALEVMSGLWRGSPSRTTASSSTSRVPS